jgi:hypothetical protein
VPSTASLRHPLLHSLVRPPHLLPVRCSPSTRTAMSPKPRAVPPWPALMSLPCMCLAKSTRACGPLHEASPARPWAAAQLWAASLLRAWAAARSSTRPRAEFGPLAFVLCFLFSKYIQILVKFKNLCRIHLNSESCETTFVG